MRLPARPSTLPSAPTTTAPTGTSPRAPAASASARAASIWLWVGRDVIRAPRRCRSIPRRKPHSMQKAQPGQHRRPGGPRAERRRPRAGPCASPRRWPAPGCARGARRSAGSRTAASPSTARSSKSPARDVSPGRPHPGRRQPAARAGAAAAVALSQAEGPGHHPQRPPGTPDRVRGCCPRRCRASSPSAGSISTPRACCCSPTTGRWPAISSCRPPAGCGATACARTAAVTQEALDKLKDGIEIDGVRYGPIEAALDKVQGANVWLTHRPARGQEPRGAHDPGARSG